MTQVASAGIAHKRAPNMERAVRKAEQDYYDCLARFGTNSAEAHAARTLWCELRSKHLC